MTDPVRIDRNDGTVTLTLNRPDRMNALSFELVRQLDAAIAELTTDPDVRVVIITGAGDRAFCAGADLKEREGMDDAGVYRTVRTLRALADAFAALPMPTIAAINGYALGGGFELALAADLRLASANATIGLTETRLGIIPGAGGTQRLPRLVGLTMAKELIFTAKRLSAEEALRRGIVTSVAESPKDLRAAANELATEIMRAAPLALREAKHALDAGANLPIERALRVESRAYDVLIPTSDRVEALAAFKEKRAPRFRGE